MKKATFTIFVTTKCNLYCTYCYERDFHKAEMSADVAQKTVAFVKKKIEENGLTHIVVRFHGGEPLLNYEVIAYIMDAFADSLCKTSFFMTTNATLIRKEMIPALAKFESLSVSIDGTAEEHNKNRINMGGQGTFCEVCKSVDLLLRYIPNLTARMTITPDTYKRVYDNFKSIADLGIKNIDADLDFTSSRWTSEMLAEYLDELKKIAIYIRKREKEGVYINSSLIRAAAVKTKNTLCDGGKSSFSITPDGKIYPCMAVAFNEEFLLGTVETGINNEKLLDKIKEIGNERNKQCEGCARYDYCIMTRCKIINYAYTGDFNLPVPIMCANEHIKVKFGKYLLNLDYSRRSLESG